MLNSTHIWIERRKPEVRDVKPTNSREEQIFSRVQATLEAALAVRQSVGWSVRPPVAVR